MNAAEKLGNITFWTANGDVLDAEGLANWIREELNRKYPARMGVKESEVLRVCRAAIKLRSISQAVHSA